MIGEKIFCGLDIGSRQIKAALIKIKKQKAFDLLAVHSVMTRGLKNVSVSDLGEFSDAMHTCLKSTMKKAQVNLKDVQVGISGEAVEYRRSSTVIPLLDKGSKVIVASDVEKVNKQARLLGVKMEEEVLHDFPLHYVIDESNVATNPVGLFGRKLEVNFLLILSRENLIRNITKAVNQAGYEVSRISFGSLLAAEVALAEKNKSEGCALVDIGAGTTDVLIFKDGLLYEVDLIHLGGDHITGSIAQALNLPFDLADDLKKSYAMTFSEDAKSNEDILIKKESQYMPIKRELIHKAVEPEIEKIVSCVRNTVKHSSIYDRLNTGVVMTGGASLLPGFIERIEKELNLPVKIGNIGMASAGISNSAIYAGAVGLAFCGFTRPFRYLLLSRNQLSWRAEMSNRIKEWYQEYF